MILLCEILKKFDIKAYKFVQLTCQL